MISVQDILSLVINNQVPPIVLLPNFLVQWKVLQPFRKQVNFTPIEGSLLYKIDRVDQSIYKYLLLSRSLQPF
ncbi:hypothetical protein KC19_7G059900 [Ceratodon purpureus]|uniref:Uncharacterized protein n=1 Tax=Ceratodon purpureus TaxID=3225 RepID=A0A8T0H522_CERPU|nr:hypothetical protein KC19_7G059900 [Ceratodon purpureus]